MRSSTEIDIVVVDSWQQNIIVLAVQYLNQSQPFVIWSEDLIEPTPFACLGSAIRTEVRADDSLVPGR